MTGQSRNDGGKNAGVRMAHLRPRLRPPPWLVLTAIFLGIGLGAALLFYRGRASTGKPGGRGAAPTNEDPGAFPPANTGYASENAAVPRGPNGIVLPGFDAAKPDVPPETMLRSMRWSWLDPNSRAQVTRTAQAAFEEATKYVLGERPRQKEALRLYQRVLDANPPRELELHVRLTMGARMTALFDPDLGENSLDDEAIRWYDQIVQDFNNWSNHHDLMVAKIHRADLYCMGDYGISQVEQATRFCRQVIDIQQDQVVFDDPEFAYLNLDNIAKAVAPVGRRTDKNGQLLKKPTEQMNQQYRRQLLEQRQEVVDRLCRAAILAMADKQHVPGFPAEIKLKRLISLKQDRPADKLYQETLEACIEDFIESHRGIKSDYQRAVDEVIETPGKPG